jgi:hypothetical protein
VIIHNLDIARIAIPAEADAPLIVDPNAMLARPVPAQRLKPVARRDPQIFKPHCRVEQYQLAARGTFDRSKPPDRLVIEELLGFAVAKASDHTPE